MLRLFVAATLLCLTAMPTHAQTHESLRGLKRLHLKIDHTTGQPAECGITKQLIHDAFMYPASGAKFEVVDDPNAPTFLIEIITFKSLTFCSTSVNFLVATYQPVTLAFSNQTIALPLLLHYQAGLAASDVSEHPARMKVQIEDMTKAFITVWNLANK
jgi:hypothetical protein